MALIVLAVMAVLILSLFMLTAPTTIVTAIGIYAGFHVQAPGRIVRCVPQGARTGNGVQAAPRLLVAIASKHVPARSHYLVAVVDEYLSRFDGWDVDVTVDTDAPAVADFLAERFPRGAWPRGKTLSVAVWSLADLAQLRVDVSIEVEPIAMRLALVHRAAFARAAAARSHDFFLYTEDDVRTHRAALEYFSVTRRELWVHGWIPGFYRVEGTPPHLTDIGGRTIDADVLVAPSGATFVTLATPYAAMWVLDAAQVRAFMLESTFAHGVLDGFYGPRERFAVGWALAPTDVWGMCPTWWTALTRSTCQAYTNRALVPILANGTLDTRAAVEHLPGNYYEEGLAVQDLLVWTHGVPAGKPLPETVHPICQPDYS